jgi:hypothetical protein
MGSKLPQRPGSKAHGMSASWPNVLACAACPRLGRPNDATRPARAAPMMHARCTTVAWLMVSRRWLKEEHDSTKRITELP